MTRIIADISDSLDGFVTGPDPSPDNGLGTGGEACTRGRFPTTPTTAGSCARGPPARAPSSSAVTSSTWSTGRKAGTTRPATAPARSASPAFVIVTSSPPESVRTTNLDWTFVTTGLPDAVTAARERAEAASSDSGKDLDVILMGGGATIGSALDAGLVDALTLHLAPIVLGAGTPLFTGERRARWCSGA